ncbi:hypothetical protein GCM10027444_31030 [Actinopolyspora lacussalsi]
MSRRLAALGRLLSSDLRGERPGLAMHPTHAPGTPALLTPHGPVPARVPEAEISREIDAVPETGGGISGTALAAGATTSGSDLHNVGTVLARAAPENPRRRRLLEWWEFGCAVLRAAISREIDADRDRATALGPRFREKLTLSWGGEWCFSVVGHVRCLVYRTTRWGCFS